MKKLTLTLALILPNLLGISAQTSSNAVPSCSNSENINYPIYYPPNYPPNQGYYINPYGPISYIDYPPHYQIGNYPFYHNGWRPISPQNFNLGYASIMRYVFDENRFIAAKRFVRNQHLSVNQVIKLMHVFTFEKTKLKFAKYAYKKTFDTQNYFRVFDFLFFEKSKRELDQFIESQ